MSNITVYLAGACKNVPDEGKEWRSEITTKLQAVAAWNDFSVKVINPTDYFTYSEKKHRTNKQVKEFFMDKILHCDLVICNCNHTNSSPGTAQEVQFAVDHLIPVIGYGYEDAYPWIVERDCQVVFNTMTEVVDYIRDYYFI